MPFFGVDDVLFLLASTTAVLWAKRGDVAQESLLKLPPPLRAPETDSEQQWVPRRGRGQEWRDAGEASTAPETRYRQLLENPRLLLRGFDLQEEDRREAARRMLSGAQTDGDSPELLSSTHAAGTAAADPLVTSSRVHQFASTPAVEYERPNVPHRHYNPGKRLPHVTALATYTEDEVSRSVRRYSLAEVHALFAKLQREGRWEAVITVSRGIEMAQARLTYLTQRNVEAGLRTLCSAGKSDLALAFYLTYGEDILPADDIVVALFDASRYMSKAALQLCETLKPFQEWWTPAVYACCLTATARTDYKAALRLYDAYVQAHPQDAGAADSRRRSTPAGSLKRVLASPALLLREGALAGDGPCASPRESAPDPAATRLQNLYHIIIPLVMEHEPGNSQPYVDDMMRNEPHVAPDVLLQCLWTEQGRKAATTYLAAQEAGEHAESSLCHNSWQRWQQQQHGATVGGGPLPLGELAFRLYQMNPSARNMNSLLKIVMHAPLKDDAICPPGARTPAKGLLPYDENLAHTRAHGSARLADLFAHLPLPSSDVDTAILARSLTEHQASWAVAAQFMSVMVRRKRFRVVPMLAHHLARQGRWDSVARAMAVYLSNQRSAMTVAEVGLCIEASANSGRWSSALFWVERAHSRQLVLPKASYDTALSVSRHCHWEASARVLKSMHEAGGTCSQKGVLSVLEAAANQGRIAKAMEVLAFAGGIRWTP